MCLLKGQVSIACVYCMCLLHVSTEGSSVHCMCLLKAQVSIARVYHKFLLHVQMSIVTAATRIYCDTPCASSQ